MTAYVEKIERPASDSMSTAMPDRLLKLAEVKATIGMGHTWIYSQIAAGKFPSPVKLSEQASRWRASEIVAWMDGLKKA